MKLLYEESFQHLEEGSVVKGRVIRVDRDQVLVDVGYKSEGVVSLREFSDPRLAEVGSEVEVLLEQTEDQDGMVVLSKRKADRMKNWEKLVTAFDDGEIMEGKITSRVKGGYNVDLGMETFLPASQVSLRPSGPPGSHVGKVLRFKIIKLNKRRKNVVLSHRVVLEEEREVSRERVFKELEIGQLRKGEVKNITDFGAFVDLGGIDGLLHITDMSWGRISHPSEVVAVGDEIEVMVLNFNREKQKISLGLKQKTPSPWENVEERYPVDSRQKGRVVNITDYGAFVELEKGVEGLVHISEMSWTRRLGHPTEVVAIGDVVEIVVLSIDTAKHKISLGMRQVEANPWTLVKEKYPVGTRITGRIRNLTDYGAFMEVEEGIDGLIHVSDLSWERRVNHPSEVLKKGDRVEAVVLSISPSDKRIGLGIKQLHGDPWSTVAEDYKVGQVISGTVVKTVSFGAFVALEGGIEGLAHVSQLGREEVARVEDVVTVGDRVEAEIVRLEPEKKKMGLAIKEVLETAAAAEPEASTEAETEVPAVAEPEAPALAPVEPEAQAGPDVPGSAESETPAPSELEESGASEPETAAPSELEEPGASEPETVALSEPEEPGASESETPAPSEPEEPSQPE